MEHEHVFSIPASWGTAPFGRDYWRVGNALIHRFALTGQELGVPVEGKAGFRGSRAPLAVSLQPAWLCLFYRQPPGAVTSCGISVLREAFKILSNSGDSDALFTKLDETDLPSPKQLSPSVSHRTKRRREAENQDSETSHPPEIPHNIKNLFSISNLIVELDGSSSKSSESPDSSQEHVVSSASKPAQKLPDEPLSAQSDKYGAPLVWYCLLCPQSCLAAVGSLSTKPLPCVPRLSVDLARHPTWNWAQQSLSCPYIWL